MNQILVIAWREISRLKKRFSGGASPLAVLALLVVVGAAAYFLRDMVSLGSGLYRVAVFGDVPPIVDLRFAVRQVASPEEGAALLAQKKVDVFVEGAQVHAREDDKSQYALKSLRQYLETQEIKRIGASYEAARAFPLRVEINYLPLRPPPGQSPQKEVPPVDKPKETVIPSITPPPAPFAQVLVALLFIMPITFISIFFTSSFMDEKINRRLSVLLSAPVTPFQIVFGKMTPYALFALTGVALVAFFTGGRIGLSLAIFAPTVLFIFAIYLMAPLFYRTFKDVTFIAMFVTTATTAYLVFPAMFANANDVSYISPLTLAVKMYRNEPFGWREYLFPSIPMAGVFVFAMFAATRLLNEEFLMGYKPMTQKIKDAIYLMMARSHPYLAVPLWSLIAIPGVYMSQVIFIAFASNLPLRFIVGAVLVASALMEEIVKSVGIVALWEHGGVKHARDVFGLSFLSGLGFLVGEKALVAVSISMVSEARVSGAMFGAGLLLLIPLAAHFLFTSVTVFLRVRWKFPYWLALAISTAVHFVYNYLILVNGGSG